MGSFGNDTTVDLMYTLTGTILKYMNGELQTIQLTNITLDSLLMNSPQTRKLVATALSNQPELLGWLMYAPVNNAEKLIEMFSSNNFLAYMCNHSSSQIATVFKLPPSVNVTEVHSAICRLDIALLERELTNMNGVADIIAQLRDIVNLRSSMRTNLTEIMRQSVNLSRLINQMNVKDASMILPQIDAKGIERVLQDFWLQYSAMDSRKLSPDILTTMRDLVETLYGIEGGDRWMEYMEIYNTYMNYVSDIFSNMTRTGNTLYFGRLFENSTRLLHHLRVISQADPDFLNTLLDTSVRINKVWQFEFNFIKCLFFLDCIISLLLFGVSILI